MRVDWNMEKTGIWKTTNNLALLAVAIQGMSGISEAAPPYTWSAQVKLEQAQDWHKQVYSHCVGKIL